MEVEPTHLGRDEEPVIVPQTLASPSFAVDAQKQQNKREKRQRPYARKQAGTSLFCHCETITRGCDKELKRKRISRSSENKKQNW